MVHFLLEIYKHSGSNRELLTQHCFHARECKTISDKQWLKVGVMRTLSNESTGRGFLQSVFDSLSISIKRNHYFEALKSERRLISIKCLSLIFPPYFPLFPLISPYFPSLIFSYFSLSLIFLLIEKNKSTTLKGLVNRLMIDYERQSCSTETMLYIA